MKALEVEINGRPVCTAGLPQFGVVACILSGDRLEAGRAGEGVPDPDWQYSLSVTGLHDPEPDVKEHVEWYATNLEVGNEVLVRLVERESVDQPIGSQRETKADEISAKRVYLARLREQVACLEEELAALD